MQTLTRSLIIFIFVGLLPYISHAQTKPEKANATSEKTFRGVINPLNETQTWATVYPDKLHYWNKTMKTGGFYASLKDYPQNLNAKRAKNGTTADYTFTFLSEGIQNVRLSNIIANPQGGVLVEYTYTFPSTLQVADKDNNVLKTFILSDGENEMTALVHPSFLNEAVSGSESPKIEVVSRFRNEEEAIKAIDAKKNDYLVRIEYNAYYDLVARASEIISHGYGFPKSMYAPVVLEVNKKEKTQFAALNEKTDMLKSAINEYMSVEAKDNVMERLIELGEYFESNYDPAGSAKDVIQLYAFNSAMAYLFGGASDDAYRQFRIAEPVMGFVSMPMIGFETWYPVITDMNNLYATANERETVDRAVCTIEERGKMEKKAIEMANRQLADANLKKLAARNITDVPGYVTTGDGGKIEGNVSIKFVELSPSQIVDMSIGKVVWIKNGKTQAFKTREVSGFVAGEKRYEPVTLPGSAAVKALGALMSGSTDNSYFMEVVYARDNYTAYVDPRVVDGERYYVKSNGDGTTELYDILIKGGKATDKFLGDRFPEVAARIGAQEFTSSRDGLTSFIDALADSGK